MEHDAPDPDIALMLRTKGGDAAAYGVLVRAHQKAVMNFLARCGVSTDIEDLAQEVFIKIWNSRARYTPSAKFTTFLYTVARRAMIDWMRSNARRNAFKERYGEELGRAERKQPGYCLDEDAAKALSCLSREQRETVVLVLMQGMRYDEAAQALGIPAGTAKSRVSIALEKMRRTMAGS